MLSRMLCRVVPFLFVLLLHGGFSCAPESTPTENRNPDIRFDPAAYAAGDFYAIPFPSDLRRRPDGTVDLQTMPARQTNYLLRTFLPALEDRFDGFSPNGAILFFFDALLLAESLPPVTDTTSPDSPVQLVNIEPGSSRFGERIPVETRFTEYAGMFHPLPTLTVLPAPGFPMAPGERYAAVLRTTIETEAGPLPPHPAVQALLTNPQNLPAAGFAFLAEALDALSLSPVDIAAATVFTTADPGKHIRLAREVIVRDVEAPQPFDIEIDPYAVRRCHAEETTTYHLVQGRFTLPSFLAGDAPYLTFGHGVFVTEPTTGEPLIQGWEEIDFTLSVPDTPPPADGFPVVIYMHGAGGSRHSFVNDRTACSLAYRGTAGLAIDFPLHGARNPPPHHNITYLLVNPNNIPAVIDLENQAAIDLYSVRRLVPNIQVPAGLAGPYEFGLDAEKVGFIGHSQGAFVGVPYLAYEPDVRAAVFSGAGAHGITFITDRIAGESIDLQLIFGMDDASALQDAVAVLLGIPGEVPDRFHFLFSIIQMVFDPADPVNYAPLVIRETPDPKHVYVSAGFLDEYDPPAVNQALATSLGLDIIEPAGMPFPYTMLRGGRVLPAPVAGNLSAAGRSITGVNAHFPEGDHWVYLADIVARKQGTDFLVSALHEDVPAVEAGCTHDTTSSPSCLEE
jgi:pimeloyl-ACP methyl ester carboxylesterase